MTIRALREGRSAMPDIKKFACAVLISSLFLSFPARAGEGADEITLEDVDINKDGAVSSDEAKAYLEKLNAEYALERQRLEHEKQENERRQNKQVKAAEAITFHPADINKDGVISPDEHAAYLAKANPAPVKKVETDKLPAKKEEIPEFLQKKYDKRLKEMAPHDANQDGILQAEELEKKIVTDFGNTDTNKDGILSPDEMAAFRQKIKEESLKTYGSKNWANQHAMKFKNYYKQADKNEDDKVSQEEYEAYFRGRYGKFDRDGDGIVNESEYRSDFEKLPRSYKRKKEDKP